MDRQKVWRDFDSRWIVFIDDDVAVINKPVGVPSQAIDPQRPDDIVNRFREFLKAGGEEGPYLGVHQRLDQDTSGVMVLTRNPAANPSIAHQFEERTVEKMYVAGVLGWPPGTGRVTLRDSLRRGDGGRMMVVPRRASGAQIAITHAEVLDRCGDRTLLGLLLETGRTHQLRVQLMNAHAPIAGDRLYGGPETTRLLLHAHTLQFRHPRSGNLVKFEAPVPPEFYSWLRGEDSIDHVYSNGESFDCALDRAIQKRFALGRADKGIRATTAFRLIHGEGDGFPQLAVDLYGGHLVVQFYGNEGLWGDEARRDRILDGLFARGFDGIYVKVRPKQANTIVDTRQEAFAPTEPVRGMPAPFEGSILEEGIEYGVRLADGLSTGIFLDQRSNRVHVRNNASGRSVLNLFAYTCGFSVAAAVGGAWRTVSVDVSMGALERGRHNFQRLGLLETADHQFVAEDVFDWLARAKRRGNPLGFFDVVILDPPSYSTTKKRRFSSSDDYRELAAAALRMLRPGGSMLACSNHRGLSRGKLRRFAREAAKLTNHRITQLKDLPDPPDYPAPFGRESHLKSIWLTVARAGT